MRRKLIQHGLSSLTLSLPRKWVKANNLSKGDEVEVETAPKKLVISARAVYPHRKICLDVTGAQPMIKRIIASAFKAGYDEIAVTFGSHDELKIVSDLVRTQFLGFEILGQTKTTVTIKNLSAPSFEEFDNALRRFFLMLNELSQGVADALSEEDNEWLRNLALQKAESDKLTDYCRRALNMGHEPGKSRIGPLYTIIEQLEKTVDRYAEICHYCSENRIRPSKEIKAAMKDIAAFQRAFYELYYKFSMKGIVGLGRQKYLLQDRLDTLGSSCPKDQVKLFELCSRILNLTFDLNGPLMASQI